MSISQLHVYNNFVVHLYAATCILGVYFTNCSFTKYSKWFLCNRKTFYLLIFLLSCFLFTFYHILTTPFMEKLEKKEPQYCVWDSRTQIEQTKGKFDAVQHRVAFVETMLQLNKQPNNKMKSPHGASNAVLKISCRAEFNVPVFSNNNLESRSRILQPKQTSKVSGKAKCSSNRWNPYFKNKKNKRYNNI